MTGDASHPLLPEPESPRVTRLAKPFSADALRRTVLSAIEAST
jgi:hypothetical protein